MNLYQCFHESMIDFQLKHGRDANEEVQEDMRVSVLVARAFLDRDLIPVIIDNQLRVYTGQPALSHALDPQAFFYAVAPSLLSGCCRPDAVDIHRLYVRRESFSDQVIFMGSRDNPNHDYDQARHLIYVMGECLRHSDDTPS